MSLTRPAIVNASALRAGDAVLRVVLVSPAHAGSANALAGERDACNQYTQEPETRHKGDDLCHFVGASPAACCAACSAEGPACAGFVFDASDYTCRLKHKHNNATRSHADGVVSAFRSNALLGSRSMTKRERKHQAFEPRSCVAHSEATRGPPKFKITAVRSC